MRVNRFNIQTSFIVLLPILVVCFGLGLFATVVLVLVGLLWRWMLTLSQLRSPPRHPALRLETISVSHFVEKVRWSLDRLGVPYEEEHNAGILGVSFVGRSVPRLHVRTGMVTSVIGNSSDILRYLWGAFATDYGERAAFLEPRPEALELERRFDEYGVDLQRWLYYHSLADRKFTLHAWGRSDPRVPRWQRAAIIILFPLLRALMRNAFRLGGDTKQRSVKNIERLLGDMNARLADGRKSLLGDTEPSFVDITLASLSGLWVYPPEYGGGKADAVIPPLEQFPPEMAGEMNAWRQQYPFVTAFVESLYRDERHRRGND